jgi:hypothetical protein
MDFISNAGVCFVFPSSRQYIPAFPMVTARKPSRRDSAIFKAQLRSSVDAWSRKPSAEKDTLLER